MDPVTIQTLATGSPCLIDTCVSLGLGGWLSPEFISGLSDSIAPLCQGIAANALYGGAVRTIGHVRGATRQREARDAIDTLCAKAAASCIRDAAKQLDTPSQAEYGAADLKKIAKALETSWAEHAGKLEATRPTRSQIARWVEASGGTQVEADDIPSPMTEGHWLSLVVNAAPNANKLARAAAAAALHQGFSNALLTLLRSDDEAARAATGAVQLVVLGELFAQLRELSTSQDAMAQKLKTLATGDDIQWALRVGVDTLRDEVQTQAALLLEALRPSAPPLYMPGRALRQTTDDAAEEPIDEDRFDRFLFQAQRLPVVGRETERDELARWLLDGRPFSWDLWTGPAGAGKSRLALDLCLAAEAGQLGSLFTYCDDNPAHRLASRAWRAGFIEWGKAAVDVERWERWKPGEPTLVVIDYVAERAEDLTHVLGKLAQRADLDPAAPVRVLLLERDFKRPGNNEVATLPMPAWVDRLSRHDLTNDGELTASHARRRREVIERPLRGVSREAALDIVRLEADLGGETLDDEAAVRRLIAIAPIDPTLRPLFVAMAAEAIRLGGAEVDAQLPSWNPQLLADYIQRKLLGKWDQRLEKLGVDGVGRRKLGRLVALATLSRGLDAADLAVAFAHRHGNLLPDEDHWEAWCPHMLLTPGAHVGYAPPLEPDIIGEAFVLGLVAGGTDRDRRLMELVWAVRGARGGPRSANPGFLTRAAQNFPEHPAMGVLLDPTIEEADAQRLAAAQEARLGKLEGIGRPDQVRTLGAALSDDDRQPLVLRTFGLFATTIGGMSPEELDRFEARLGGLPMGGSLDSGAREWLAKGLFNALNNAEPTSDRATGLLQWLQDLHDVDHSDAAVREPLARSLVNAISRTGPERKRADRLIQRLRGLHDSDRGDAALREKLAMGLFNAFNNAEPNSEWADGLLQRLQSLHDLDRGDAAVREQLARGLFNAFNHAEPNSERADGLLQRLQSLHDLDPRDAAVRGGLARGLLSAFNPAEPNSMRAGGLLQRFQGLYDLDPRDAAVGEQLAMGLFNAFYRAKLNNKWADGLLRRLRALHQAFPTGATIAWAAMKAESLALLRSVEGGMVDGAAAEHLERAAAAAARCAASDELRNGLLALLKTGGRAIEQAGDADIARRLDAARIQLRAIYEDRFGGSDAEGGE